ncbi:tRNA (guanine-N(7)-)-methyltransferase non-catalytic subunit trm82 [Cytospora mali]|uniref:tRNA (Guanine-N(7)-)-methyltransferase non-catalytic subunit trm82 n=1 Tax=Cytospora mali TaxID=578113 RepID=A0A194VSJ0_CYTMA|nr:tRNA (guanine-N(7)-)-methyltransferase non-catalytic subunit trm82 [Valsa mali]
MKLPFHNVQVCGDVLFAARGGNIHSFKLTDGSHISCWRYPVEKKDGKSGLQSTPAAPSQNDQGPPAKRVKLDPEEAANGDAAAEGKPAAEENGNGTPRDQKKGKKQGPRPGPMSQPSERPMVIILTATSDGRHLVAVTQCKSIWVFEHDGHGQLKQLSRRTMPKRPCSIVFTLDSQSILSADKFGDVYSLPLTPSDNVPVPRSKEASPAAPSPAPASPSPAPDKSAYKPQANELTVHTKRNRQALIDQQLSVNNPSRNRGGTQKTEAPTFELTLLLGHVSLLTAVALGRDAQGRPYIITADRDEHIRVSRGTKEQAHVIETFCLGHEDFVNRLCIPDEDGFGDLLVSGGGDTDLFVWRWREGNLLARTPLLKVVKEVVPEAGKIAVSGLLCWTGRPAESEEKGVTILAICERVPAIFMFTLKTSGSLEFARMISLPSNPLEVEVVDGERLLVAVEPNALESGEYDAKKSLLKVEHINGEYQVSDEVVNDVPDLGDNETDIATEEIQMLLYSAENLRKMDFEDGGPDAE